MYGQPYGGMGMNGYGGQMGGMGLGGGMGMGAYGAGGLNGGGIGMQSSLREEKVRGAVSFFQNPKVIKAAPSEGISFLIKDKGLTINEVGEALKRVRPNAAETNIVENACKMGQTYDSIASQLAGLSSSSEEGKNEGGESTTGSTGGTSSTGKPVSGWSQNPPTPQSALPRDAPYAFGMFAPPVLPLPQYPPPQGMVAIAPGLYSFLPGAAPPGTSAHHMAINNQLGAEQARLQEHGIASLPGQTINKPTASWIPGVANAAAALTVVAGLGYAAKRYWWDGQVTSEGNQGEGLENDKKHENNHDELNSSSTTPNGPWESKSSKNSPVTTFGSDAKDPYNLQHLSKLAQDTKEDVISKSVAEMNNKVSALGDQLKAQSSEMTKALELFQQTIVALQAGKNLPVGNVEGTEKVGEQAVTKAQEANVSPLERGLNSIDAAMTRLRGEDEKLVSTAFKTMGLYLSNTVAKPDTFNKIWLSNSRYQRDVAPVPGAQELLLAAGFSLKPPYLEWQKIDESLDEASSTVSAEDAKLIVQFAKDCVTRFPDQPTRPSAPIKTAITVPVTQPSANEQPLSSTVSLVSSDNTKPNNKNVLESSIPIETPIPVSQHYPTQPSPSQSQSQNTLNTSVINLSSSSSISVSPLPADDFNSLPSVSSPATPVSPITTVTPTTKSSGSSDNSSWGSSTVKKAKPKPWEKLPIVASSTDSTEKQKESEKDPQ